MLSIGDFARYAGVSVRVLRHYDAIGLLPPSYVDPSSGYRFYEQALLERANAVVALRDLGFSLAQVATLLEGSLTTAGMRSMLDQRRQELQSQIDHDRARLADVERRLRLMEGMSTMELEYTEKSLPALDLVQVTDQVGDMDEIGPRVGPMFGRLMGSLAAAGRSPSGPAMAWYDGQGDQITFGTAVESEPVDGLETGHLAAVDRAVTAVYRGSMQGIGEAWQALATHVQQQGLTLSGPSREIYLVVDESDPDAWVTELQQPVL